MNQGMYGYGLPPNNATRVAPSRWTNFKLITTTTSTETVPLNVYQIGVAVWGGGGNGALTNDNTTPMAGGGGGGFSYGILDVIPGQTLPTLTVGAQGGTSSCGTLLSSTGGANAVANTPGAGGAGTASPT